MQNLRNVVKKSKISPAILLILVSVLVIAGIGYVSYQTIGNFLVIPAFIIGIGLLTGLTGGPQK